MPTKSFWNKGIKDTLMSLDKLTAPFPILEIPRNDRGGFDIEVEASFQGLCRDLSRKGIPYATIVNRDNKKIVVSTYDRKRVEGISSNIAY